jgi:hypothetical protein
MVGAVLCVAAGGGASFSLPILTTFSMAALSIIISMAGVGRRACGEVVVEARV